MTVVRMDNVAIVVDDLDAAIAFFEEIGLTLEGTATVEGEWVDGVLGLAGARSHIALLRTPDGRGRVELSRFESPVAAPSEPPAANTVGMTRIMFTVDSIDDTVERLQRHGARVLDRIARYEDAYRLCYLRGPAGIIVALAEELG